MPPVVEAWCLNHWTTSHGRTLRDPMDCSPPGSSVHWDSPGKNTRVGCHAFFQGIFPTQGSNPGLPHCRQIPYCLSHQGSPLFGFPYTEKFGNVYKVIMLPSQVIHWTSFYSIQMAGNNQALETYPHHPLAVAGLSSNHFSCLLDVQQWNGVGWHSWQEDRIICDLCISKDKPKPVLLS